MVLYTLWCYGSMVLPHQYPPVVYPLNGQVTAVLRFIELSTVIPFTLYLLGRRLFARESAVRFVLWSIVGFAAYIVDCVIRTSSRKRLWLSVNVKGSILL